MHTLYISYFGLREPLVQTQVLPYLREIQKDGHEVSLITFEPDHRNSWTAEESALWASRLATEGIQWRSLAYHKRPSLPATLYDIIAGSILLIRMARRSPIDVFHARGYVPAAMGAIAKLFTKTKLIFDIRGLLPEEYADAGVWQRDGLLHRLTKSAEKHLIAAADGFVVLTKKARHILFPSCDDRDTRGRPIELIPCCVDLKRFQSARELSREQAKTRLGLSGRRVIAYVGALGGWYLTKEIADFLAVAHRADSATFSMILTQSPPEMISRELNRLGVEATDYLIKQVAPAEIPTYLQAADMALSFIKPSYSKLSSSPTKIAEYLASGLPIICNAGIGDVDELIESERAGVILETFSEEAYLAALARMRQLLGEADINDRCRAAAYRHFDLETIGGAKYRRLYERLGGTEPAEPVKSQAA